MALTFYVFPYAGQPFLQTSRALILSMPHRVSMPALGLPLAESYCPCTDECPPADNEYHALSGQAKCETWVSSALQQKGVTHRQGVRTFLLIF